MYTITDLTINRFSNNKTTALFFTEAHTNSSLITYASALADLKGTYLFLSNMMVTILPNVDLKMLMIYFSVLRIKKGLTVA